MRIATTFLALFLLSTFASAQTPIRLKVSNNKRYLETEEGKPFFWLGDTAWELFHRLNREEADRYLDNRARLGFTVIQAVALAEMDGLNAPNAYNHRPLIDNDPTRPDIKDGENNDYWDHVDYIVRKANSLGLTVGFLPSWGDKWNKKWGAGPEVFTPDNAEAYGKWLGNRYKDASIVWILGGDRPIENDTHRAIIERMAKGLSAGDGGKHLMTFHPVGGKGSSEYFHEAAWLSFNMRQNGHTPDYTGHYDQTLADYQRQPTKPVLDGEPIYESHPVAFNQKNFGHSIASDVRRPLYWNLFSGAFGHTYGNHAVWQMWTPNRQPINDPLMPWDKAIDEPGAAQMQHAKTLLMSRSFATRIPDDSMIVTDRVATSIPGAGRYRFVCTRDTEGTYALIYAPISRSFSVHMDRIQKGPVAASWFDPRTGQSTAIGEFPNTDNQTFDPPNRGEMQDWVLVLESKK